MCVEMKKNGSRYDVRLASVNLGSQGSNVLMCEMETPDGILQSLGACEGSFVCDSCRGTDSVKLYARYLNTHTERRYYKELVERYNFADGVWGGSSHQGGNQGNTQQDTSTNRYLSVSTNQRSPEINTYVDVRIEVDRDYRGKVRFEMQYQAPHSSSWQTVSSSNYFSASEVFTDGYVFSRSDDGRRNFYSFVSFAKEGSYRLYVSDDSRRSEYVSFVVEAPRSQRNSYLNLSATTLSPALNMYVDVTVETDRDYRDTVEFDLEYRASSSSSWSRVSATSSDISSDRAFSNGYQFSSADNGYKTFFQFLKFHRAGEYRLLVKDRTGREKTITFSVEERRTPSARLRITTNQSRPQLDQYITLNVETDVDYRAWVDFEVEYRASNSSSWSRVTSREYFTADRFLTDGYQFTSYDRGFHSFVQGVKFHKAGQYKVSVRNADRKYDYVQFDVEGNRSSVEGFSYSELRKITNVSRIWNSAIDQLKNQSYRLRTDSYWQRLSDALYTNMRDVVLGNYYRAFRTYSDFLSAFRDWYNYTIRNR